MGSHLATMLSGNGHDITVIDRDAKALEEVGTLADIITVEGDSTTFEALRKASTRKCDLFIAVNHTENDNIVAAVIAKQLGARKTIARIDNNEYLEPNNKEIFIEMGIDYLFYPERSRRPRWSICWGTPRRPNTWIFQADGFRCRSSSWNLPLRSSAGSWPAFRTATPS